MVSIKDALNQYFYFSKGSTDYMYLEDVAHSDKLTENDHPTLHFPSALWCFSLFQLWFDSPQLN